MKMNLLCLEINLPVYKETNENAFHLLLLPLPAGRPHVRI